MGENILKVKIQNNKKKDKHKDRELLKHRTEEILKMYEVNLKSGKSD